MSLIAHAADACPNGIGWPEVLLILGFFGFVYLVLSRLM